MSDRKCPFRRSRPTEDQIYSQTEGLSQMVQTLLHPNHMGLDPQASGNQVKEMTYLDQAEGEVT